MKLHILRFATASPRLSPGSLAALLVWLTQLI